MVRGNQPFSSTWIVVVAMADRAGERPDPQRLVATDVETQQLAELTMPALRQVNGPPYPVASDCLLITVDGAAVAGTHLSLGWPAPERMIDLMVEFRNIANGHPPTSVGGLAGALLWFGKSTTGAIGAAASAEQLRTRLSAAAILFQAMRPSLDLGRALLRGRYLIAAAAIEASGVPVDLGMIQNLRMNWPAIRDHIISNVDQAFGFYSERHFDLHAFTRWVADRAMPWPRLASGQLDLGNDAFKEMARIDPDLAPIKELRATLTGFNPAMLAIGSDGRNRLPLRPFASTTSRNQPSANVSILGSPRWARYLIKPHAGMALAYVDWQHEEFGIAAALSEDQAMRAAYLTGDPYLAMAVAAKVLPEGATATSHPQERAQFKASALGILNGMGAATLSRRLNCSEQHAAGLLAVHRKTFPRFWSWSDGIENHALLRRELVSAFGWRLAVCAGANPRSLRNFPMQANGAEMLRLACCLATENGITVCAPNHDALLIEAPANEINAAVTRTQRFMAEASATVLDGFELRSDVRVVKAPDRWTEQRGQAIWSAVQQALGPTAGPVRERDRTCSPAISRAVSLYVSKEDSTDASD